MSLSRNNNSSRPFHLVLEEGLNKYDTAWYWITFWWRAPSRTSSLKDFDELIKKRKENATQSDDELFEKCYNVIFKEIAENNSNLRDFLVGLIYNLTQDQFTLVLEKPKSKALLFNAMIKIEAAKYADQDCVAYYSFIMSFLNKLSVSFKAAKGWFESTAKNEPGKAVDSPINAFNMTRIEIYVAIQNKLAMHDSNGNLNFLNSDKFVGLSSKQIFLDAKDCMEQIECSFAESYPSNRLLPDRNKFLLFLNQINTNLIRIASDKYIVKPLVLPEEKLVSREENEEKKQEEKVPDSRHLNFLNVSQTQAGVSIIFNVQQMTQPVPMLSQQPQVLFSQNQRRRSERVRQREEKNLSTSPDEHKSKRPRTRSRR